MKYFMVCFFFLALTFLTAAVKYVVYPSSEGGEKFCPTGANLCKPLSHYLQNVTAYFTTGAIFSFLPGSHDVSVERRPAMVVIQDSSQLSLLGPLKTVGTAVIKCHGAAGIIFNNISSLQMKSLSFENCSMKLTPGFLKSKDFGAHQLFSRAINAGIVLNMVRNLSLDMLNVYDCTGYGMLAINTVEGAVYNDVNFTRNNFRALTDMDCARELLQQCKGGNLLILFSDFQSAIPTAHTVVIDNSLFQYGVDLGKSYPAEQIPFIAYGGAGVAIVMTQSTYDVEFIITNCNMTKNVAQSGSNLYVSVFDCAIPSSITITNCKIEFGNNIIVENELPVRALKDSISLAAGIMLAYGLPHPSGLFPACTAKQQFSSIKSEVFKIHMCDIHHNIAAFSCAGLIYLWESNLGLNNFNITISDTGFNNNIGDNKFFALDYSILNHYRLSFLNLTFQDNGYIGRSTVSQTFSQEVVYLNSIQYSEFYNCTFMSNTGSGIRVVESSVFLRGFNQFINNTALHGGGLHIEEGSTLYLTPNSTTLFKNNKALTFGGAIYARDVSYTCFFQILTKSYKPSLMFINNTALIVGNTVYGNIDFCALSSAKSFTEADHVFHNISEIFKNNKGPPISSIVRNICFCHDNGTINCDSESTVPSKSVYPGQKFVVTIAARGYVGISGSGYTTATIQTEFVGNNNSASFSANQAVQYINVGCSNLIYNLFGQPQEYQVIIIPVIGRYFYPLSIHITLLKCPLGFELSTSDLPECICSKLLQNHNFLCDINTQLISKNSMLWFGVTNHTGQLSLSVAKCPKTYCDDMKTQVNINNLNEQCLNNRSGVICGSCRENYSLAIGSTRCLPECSNYYLLLLGVFIVLGVLLIVLLSALNLTVATGMINALVFYANVVKQINFPPNSYEFDSLLPFTLFINWLNLDFGIETCFYNGLNAYAKSWLQFVFPIYLFILIGLTIVISKRLTKISNVLPRNIVPVFATVILLSFTKLCRAVLASLRPVTITTVNTSFLSWHEDGNILYFKQQHIPLGIFSVIILVCFIVPYTLLLLTHPFFHLLIAREGTIVGKFYSWIDWKLFKFKPIFDAYYAPYKDNFRFWTGLFLLLRILTLIPTRNSLLSYILVFLTCVILLGIIFLFEIYHNRLTRVIECAFLINLAILQIGTAVYIQNGGTNVFNTIFCVSVGMSAIVLVFVVVVHAMPKIENKIPPLKRLHLKIQNKICSRKINRTYSSMSDLHTNYVAAVQDEVTHTSVIVD